MMPWLAMYIDTFACHMAVLGHPQNLCDAWRHAVLLLDLTALFVCTERVWAGVGMSSPVSGGQESTSSIVPQESSTLSLETRSLTGIRGSLIWGSSCPHL